MDHKKPVVLAILDGFGYSKEHNNNAIYHAKKPHIDSWLQNYPHTLLHASGTYVGLPEGTIGNSEVGHLTIGAGRIIEQPATILSNAIADKTFFNNPVLTGNLKLLKERGAPLHLMGLLSDANVHSNLALLYALLDAAHQHDIRHVFIHAFLDGRDAPPRSAATYLKHLDDALTALEYGSIGSIHGRFYAMDRDHNWERTAASYTVLTDPDYYAPQNWEDVVAQSYAQGITDEFIQPTRLDPTSAIDGGDGIIFFNFRPDRARQLTAAFVDPTFSAFPVRRLSLLFFITSTRYAANLATDVLCERAPLPDTLTQALAAAGKTIVTIAETEKYAHISYFFNGENEQPVATETRILIPSLTALSAEASAKEDEKTATSATIKRHPRLNIYLEHPCMSAQTITDAVLASLKNNPADFYLINYANADMVGHSGNFDATVKAIECLDNQLAQLFDDIVTHMDGVLLITADHGKAEKMFNAQTQQPETAHTCNDVPLIMLTQNKSHAPEVAKLTQLADIAPFILTIMNMPIPKSMTKEHGTD